MEFETPQTFENENTQVKIYKINQPSKKLKFDLEALLENNMEAVSVVRLNAIDELDRYVNEGRSLKIHEDVFDW